jgi:tRNA modification GTPase
MQVDTIVSLSTAPGPGAIAVVRMSGPDASRVLAELTATALPEERRATLMELRDPVDDSIIDRALVTRFVAPASFTGEDLVEISCHGGWLIPPMVIEACVLLGARVAEAGEFTRRAYLHGKVDLIQAEAIADLIEGRSRALHRAAIGQLERGLSRRVSVLRERLIQVEALLAHHVDFPEEDDAPVSLTRVSEEARVLIQAMEEMLATH